jgi:hypothetical protein
MGSGDMSRWQVLEVHNFGGFFGGDTVTLTAARWDDQMEETLTIDEKALSNVRERHAVAPSMVFDLRMTGERVDQADLLAAADWSLLDAALGDEPPPDVFDGPRVYGYFCSHCSLWIVGPPEGDTHQLCTLCGSPLNLPGSP